MADGYPESTAFIFLLLFFAFLVVHATGQSFVDVWFNAVAGILLVPFVVLGGVAGASSGTVGLGWLVGGAIFVFLAAQLSSEKWVYAGAVTLALYLLLVA